MSYYVNIYFIFGHGYFITSCIGFGFLGFLDRLGLVDI